MKEDKVITLRNGKQYLLLLESELDLVGFFLAVLVDEKGEPTSNYAVLREVERDGRSFAEKVDDPIVLNKLLEDYRLQYDEDYAD